MIEIMDARQFANFWSQKYPGTIPVQHLFKHRYPERWFRIHSLPESKRYPETEQEWQILLDRQNSIIADLFGKNSRVVLVTGEYHLVEGIELSQTDIESQLN